MTSDSDILLLDIVVLKGTGISMMTSSAHSLQRTYFTVLKRGSKTFRRSNGRILFKAEELLGL